ncbi:Ribosomal protein [Sergentomyia squamirostris]
MLPALGVRLLRNCVVGILPGLPTILQRSFHGFIPRIPLWSCPAQSLAPTTNQLLTTPSSPLVNLVCGFKVKGRLKRRCKDCYFVYRQQRLFVICKTHPRHKQMAMKKKEKNTWILTSASQSKVREW